MAQTIEFNPFTQKLDVSGNSSTYVPYTGATADVNLGNHTLTINSALLESTTIGGISQGIESHQFLIPTGWYSKPDTLVSFTASALVGGGDWPAGTYTFYAYAAKTIAPNYDWLQSDNYISRVVTTSLGDRIQFTFTLPANADTAIIHVLLGGVYWQYKIQATSPWICYGGLIGDDWDYQRLSSTLGKFSAYDSSYFNGHTLYVSEIYTDKLLLSSGVPATPPTEITSTTVGAQYSAGETSSTNYLVRSTSALVSTRVPYSNADGILIDASTFTYTTASGLLTVNAIGLAAGTTSRAPISFTAGTNLASATAGAMEWDGTNLYVTQTSGPTRKTIAYTTDIKTPGGSSGNVQYNNGSGGFGAEAALSYDSTTNTLTVGAISLEAGTTIRAPIKFVAGTNLSSVTDGAMEYDGYSLYMTISTGPTRKTIAFAEDITMPDDATISISDIVTNNASVAAHGWCPKLSDSASDFLDGDGTWDTVKDSDLSTSDITTNDASTSKHGFCPKLSNVSTQYLSGLGTWTTPAGSGSPGGADTHVQFNDGGSFGGESTFVYNKTTNTAYVSNLAVGITSGTLGALLHVEGQATGYGTNSGNARFLMNVDTNNNPSIELHMGKTGYTQGTACYIDFALDDDSDYDARLIKYPSTFTTPSLFSIYSDGPVYFNSHLGAVMWMTTGGKIGIKQGSAPTAYLMLPAGSTSAETAPLKFTSGSLMSSAEAGAVEFLTDKWYATITTGTARKELTLNDAALTATRVPYVTTNGRLTDSANMTFSGTVLYVNGKIGVGITPTAKLHIMAGTSTAENAPFKLTSGDLLATPETGAIEFLDDKLYLTIGSGTARKEITLNNAALTSGKLPVATTNGRLTDASSTGFLKGSSGTLSAVTNIVETDFSFTDITTANASTSNHGLLPKLNNSSTQYLNGQGNWATPAGGGTPGGASGDVQYNDGAGGFAGETAFNYNTSTNTLAVDNLDIGTLTGFLKGSTGAVSAVTSIVEGDFGFTDITTANSSTSAHGLLKKLDNTATNFMNGAGNWAVPTGYTARFLELDVQSGKLPASNPMAIDAGDQNWRGLFDATTSESAIWQFIMPQSYGSSLSLRVIFAMNAVQSGTNTVYWDASVMAVTPSSDSTDIGTDSFDTANQGQHTLANNQAAGYPRVQSITLTNADSVAAGDIVLLKLARNISDTASGDAELLGLLLEWTAAA